MMKSSNSSLLILISPLTKSTHFTIPVFGFLNLTVREKYLWELQVRLYHSLVSNVHRNVAYHLFLFAHLLDYQALLWKHNNSKHPHFSIMRFIYFLYKSKRFVWYLFSSSCSSPNHFMPSKYSIDCIL